MVSKLGNTFLLLFCFSPSEEQRNCVTAEEELIALSNLCRGPDLILLCRGCSQAAGQERGGEVKAGGSRGVTACSTRGLGCPSCTRAGAACQDSCMTPGKEPVPKQRNPYVPGSSVESSFKVLFSKLLYFFCCPLLLSLTSYIKPLWEIEMFWLHRYKFELLALFQMGCIHRKHFVPSECTCLCMCILSSVCI